jgi:hypothetical protein
MREKLADVIAERDALRKALDPTLGHLRFENGEMDMSLAGPMIENFGLAFGEWFRKLGAENYVEMHLCGPEGERYIVTARKVGGLSPADLQHMAEAERDDVVEALTELIETAQGLGYHDGNKGPCLICDAVQRAKAAVAKAKGEP